MRTLVLRLIFALAVYGCGTKSHAQELLWGEEVDGVQLGLSIQQTDFPAGKPIDVLILLKNGSDQLRRLPTLFPAAMNYKFSIMAEGNESLSPLSKGPQPFSGVSGLPLPPRSELTNEVNLASLFDLSRPGSYRVSVSRSLQSTSGEVQIYSGSATIQVVKDNGEIPNVSTSTIPNVAMPRAANRNFDLRRNGSTAGRNSANASQSVDEVARPLANAPSISNTHSFSFGRKTGVGIIAGLLAVLLAILWRAARRKRAG
jgi:hypothetical protein